jgi:lipid II:glycine glycyltransferase (peptidoglycan interpeptide bridge formation enzyme)
MEIEKGTYVLKLDKSQDELMSSFDKDLRWAIRKGERDHIPATIYSNVYVVHLQDKNYKPSSMAVFKIEGTKAILLATNTDSELKNLQGNSLAYWEIIKWGKVNGITEFDLGGIDMSPTESQERINEFKKDFGGELITYKQNVTINEWLKAKFKRFVKK